MIFTFIGTIIGAGFASGQEIRKYFVDYGGFGLIGIILVSVLFMFIGEKIMLMGYVSKSDSYDTVLNYAFRCKFKKIVDYILVFFLIATASTMFSGTGAFLNQTFGLNIIIGNALMAIVAFFITIIGIKGIMKISTVIVPILVLITCVISISSIVNSDITHITHINEVMPKGMISGVFSAIIYASYNLIMGMSVLVSLGSGAKDRKSIKITSIISGVIIGVFGLILYMALYINYGVIQGVQIPIATLTLPNQFWWYGSSFLIAVLTTAVGCLYGVYSRFNKNKLFFMGICIISYLLSLFGFSTLVANLYFIMGLFGIFIIFMLLFGFSKSISARKVR